MCIRDSSRYSYKSGWTIQCKKEGDFFSFFSPHFIQALLLRLAFAFTPKEVSYDSREVETYEDDSDEEENQVMGLVIRRVCSVWKNGIYWLEQSGVKTIVDIIDQRTLVLLMQCPRGSEVQLIKRRSLIISMVLNAKNEFCSAANLMEYFLHPQVVQHPLLNFNKLKDMMFSLPRIKDSIVKREPHVINNLDKIVNLEELLYFEPYSELSEDVTKKLFNEANSHKQVDCDLLSSIASQLHHRCELFTCLCHTLGLRIKDEADFVAERHGDTHKLLHILKQGPIGGTYRDLCQFLNQISIFCGRQPPQGM